jgi:hypothetical protein
MVTVTDFTHVLIALLAITALVLSIAPIRHIVDSDKLSSGQKVYWVVVVLMFPLIGALIWLVSTRTRE